MEFHIGVAEDKAAFFFHAVPFLVEQGGGDYQVVEHFPVPLVFVRAMAVPHGGEHQVDEVMTGVASRGKSPEDLEEAFVGGFVVHVAHDDHMGMGVLREQGFGEFAEGGCRQFSSLFFGIGIAIA